MSSSLDFTAAPARQLVRQLRLLLTRSGPFFVGLTCRLRAVAAAHAAPMRAWSALVALAAGVGALIPWGWSLSDRRRAGVAWSILAVLLGLTIALLAQLAPTFEGRLDPKGFIPWAGQAYRIALGNMASFPFAIPGDGLGQQSRSRLELLEDGRILGPGHTLHRDIEAAGGGAYSHWGHMLILSASDGSDPSNNGREYRVRIRAGVDPVLSYILLAATAIAAFLLIGQSKPRTFRSALCSLDDRGYAWTAAFAVSCTVAAIFMVFRNWETARTVSLSVSGFLPISDAENYWRCASQIASTGSIVHWPDMCAGRITYPAFLAALMALTSWNPYAVYVAQGTMVALAVAGLAQQTARLTGLAGGVLAGALLLAFAWEHALGVAMTEVAGLTAGASALALLLHGADRKRLLSVATGLFLFGVAQASRSGAMLILPALFLWIVLAGPRLGMRRWTAAGIAAFALGSGLAVQIVLVKSLDLKSGASFGNFSTVLYGLSVGGKNWSQVYKDHPELFADVKRENDANAEPGASAAVQPGNAVAEAYHKVYALAFANIRKDPGVFLNACLHMASQYPRDIFSFVPWAPQSWYILQFLLLLGGVWCLFTWRSPLSLLLIAMSVGELASAPLISDGGMRIYAGSIGLRVVLVAFGLRALSTLLWRRQAASEVTTEQTGGQSARAPVLAAAVGVLLVELACLPATGLLDYARLPGIAAASCIADEMQVITRFDRESPTLRLALDGQPSGFHPLAVHRGALIAGMQGSWFASDFAGLAPGVTIVNGIDRGLGRVGWHWRLLLDRRPAWLEPGKMVRACVARDDYVSIATKRYLRVRSVEPVQAGATDSEPQSAIRPSEPTP
jgi:hypothetical protein